MVATRSQLKAKVEANKSLLDMMPLSQVEISPPGHVKAQKSRRQRRREKLQGTVQKMGDQLPVPDVPQEALWEIPSKISELQKADESLK